MRKSARGMLAAILFHVLVPAGLHAQTSERAGEDILDEPSAICEEEAAEDGGEAHPCDQYIGAKIGDDADTIRWLLEVIDDHEDESSRTVDEFYARDQILQWTLVLLAFMITIATTITKAYPELKIRKIDFAMIPVVLAAFSAAVTSLNVYYQFSEYMRLNETVATDLAQLKSDIHFAIFRHAASGGTDETSKIDGDTINAWHDRFETIMQRYIQHESGAGG